MEQMAAVAAAGLLTSAAPFRFNVTMEGKPSG